MNLKEHLLRKLRPLPGRPAAFLRTVILCAAFCLCRTIPAQAESAYHISLNITVDTDTSRPVMPREDVPFHLYVHNLSGTAWLRVRTETLSEGIGNVFSPADLSCCDGWVRRGDYIYLTYPASKETVFQALDSFRVPDISVSDGATLTIRVRAEGIDVRSVTPDFDLEDPWKGKNPDSVAEMTFGDEALSGNASGGSVSRSSADTASSGGLSKYPRPQEGASVSTGTWYLADAEHNLWKYGFQADGQYAADGWYLLFNSYSKAAVKNQWFYFDKNGYMVSGWLDAGNYEWYHLHEVSDGDLGSLDLGLFRDPQDGRTYMLDEKLGRMLTGWQTASDGKRRYFAPITEIPAANWIYKTLGDTRAGRWFYNALGLRTYGSMYVSERTPDGTLVGADGAAVQS